MMKLYTSLIFTILLVGGCSNSYTGLGFPYSLKSNEDKVKSINIPEEGQDVIKATEEILSASVEKIGICVIGVNKPCFKGLSSTIKSKTFSSKPKWAIKVVAFVGAPKPAMILPSFLSELTIFCKFFLTVLILALNS